MVTLITETLKSDYLPVLTICVSLDSSYLHCKWATMEELEKDPRIAQKIKRFRNKQAQMKHIFTEVKHYLLI